MFDMFLSGKPSYSERRWRRFELYESYLVLLVAYGQCLTTSVAYTNGYLSHQQ